MNALLLIACALVINGSQPARRLLGAEKLRVHPLVGIVLASGGVTVLLMDRLTAAAAAIIAATTVAWTLRDIRRGRDTARRETATATFLGHLASHLRAGAEVSAAMTTSVEAMSGTAPAELTNTLRAAAGLASRGGSGAGVLAAERRLPELHGLATLWQLADRHGLPLAPLVEQAQARIDTRVRHRNATTATLQGPQATAVILTALPLAGIAMGSAMGANPLGFLLGGGLGGILLLAGVGLTSTGFIWSRTILRSAAA
ncbi:Bacterial type II secretion system protein F domain protein [Corynebacterium atrinae]|uniref:type II secretion system F family protein n=1 Tax=Corynebacterium atrinae TaxID=1336740 RepID=UPI0025B3D26B|nr:type II secretion system F family protein [Corynebacterium atrinae]WJY62367.1 Bacterial type II secretion system protein F domain protein [Corynebacterium atrinae]